jgi:dephospho-CoA kinase
VDFFLLDSGFWILDSGVSMPVIAITGGLGSGKSAVREIFEGLGAKGIDTDQLAREAVEPGTDGARMVREAFGENCFNHQGRLDRKKMAAFVFHDRAALRKLESILHPLIRQAESRLVADCMKNDPGRVVVVEVPLLAEGGRAKDYDGIVLVTAPEEVRLQRLVKSGKYEGEEALDRMKVQVSDNEREMVASWTIDNGGTMEETKSQVEKIYDDLKSKSKIPD